MPVSLPPSWKTLDKWNFATEFMSANQGIAERMVFWARLMLAGVGVLLGGLVGRWAGQRAGAAAGACAVFLYAFFPHVLGQAGLIGADLPLAAGMTAGMYWFSRWLERGRPVDAALAGLGLGLAVLAKFSGLMLGGAYLIVWGLDRWLRPERRAGAETRPYAVNIRERPAGLPIALGLGALALVVTIVVGYLVVGVSWFWHGVSLLRLEVAGGSNMNYLDGQFNRNGWWYYYLYAMVMKTPVPLLLLWGVYALSFLRKPRERLLADAPLLVPAALVVAAFSVGKVQSGLRYVLPAYPFLIVLAGGVAAGWIRHGGFPRAATCALGVWYLAGVARVAPYHAAYFNEIAGGPEQGWQHLHEPDWPFDLSGLKAYLLRAGAGEVVMAGFNIGEGRPRYDRYAAQEFTGSPATGARRFLVISDTHLKSIIMDRKDWYDWLQKYQPATRVGYSVFVYDITDNAEAGRRIGG